MTWKTQLRLLEKAEKFEEAITFMENVIKNNQNELDCYIFMLYLLVDFTMEPHKRDIDKQGIFYRSPLYNDIKWQKLATYYFQVASTKFAHHRNTNTRCDFLYYVGHICVTGFYMCGVDDEIPSQMIAQAKKENPENPVYRMGDSGDHEVAQMMFDPTSSLRIHIETKGAVGINLFEIFSSWAQEETSRWSAEDTALLRTVSLQ